MTVVFDNYSYDPDLRTAWGFSCLINGFDKTILFDTGGSGEILLYNMDKLDIRPEDIDLVVLSHIHGDHTGGLEKLMKENPNLTVYLPDSFPGSFKRKVDKYGEKDRGDRGRGYLLGNGGFHLSSARGGEIQEIVRDFLDVGVRKVAPSHCSGDRARNKFRESYENDFILSGVGKVITVITTEKPKKGRNS